MIQPRKTKHRSSTRKRQDWQNFADAALIARRQAVVILVHRSRPVGNLISDTASTLSGPLKCNGIL